MGFRQIFVTFLFYVAVVAIPRETAIVDPVRQMAAITEAAAPEPTVAPSLHCTDGSTVLHTTDCTMGTPVSYCFKKEPPMKCDKGFFPSVWHPDHCMELSTCYALDAAWITTECSNGAIPYTTKTLYDGMLAGGSSTVVSAVSCSCAADQWYSTTMLAGSSTINTFCMPYQSCPPGMTTSISINEYCATATADVCRDVPAKTSYCQCADPTETPVYPDQAGAAAIGCK